VIYGFFKLNVRSLSFSGIVNSTGNFSSIIVKTMKPVFHFSRRGVPLIKKRTRATRHFISTDRLSLLSTPLTSRWTIPVKNKKGKLSSLQNVAKYVEQSPHKCTRSATSPFRNGIGESNAFVYIYIVGRRHFVFSSITCLFRALQTSRICASCEHTEGMESPQQYI
jgi:hypothetical protein